MFLSVLALNQVQNFGEPFFLVVRENETLVDAKERIRKKLLVADEEFAKVLAELSSKALIMLELRCLFLICHSA